jgi:hypothetical protein
MKLRIAAAIAIGAVLIGLLAWPLVSPSDPLAPVRAANLSLAGAVVLAALAVLAGLLAYFASWPYGREIGILAVPSGLAVWAIRSASMARLTQLHPNFAQRQALFAALRWEPVFWLAIAAAGLVGVLLGQRIRPKTGATDLAKEPNEKSNTYVNAIISLVGSALIALFCISLLAQNVTMSDQKLRTVLGQPATGQIVFAVSVSFGVAAFVVKKFLNASYFWPVAASAIVTPFVTSTYAKESLLQYLIQRWPPVFFPNASLSILPVQMVAFGILGSVTGYWLAVRNNYRRKLKSSQSS